jgi:hypothetical protein
MPRQTANNFFTYICGYICIRGTAAGSTFSVTLGGHIFGHPLSPLFIFLDSYPQLSAFYTNFLALFKIYKNKKKEICSY